MRADEDGLEDLRETPLKEDDGAVVRVRDVATVEIGGEIRQGATTLTRRDDAGNPVALGEVVTGQVLKRLGANTDATLEGLQARVPLMRNRLPIAAQVIPWRSRIERIRLARSLSGWRPGFCLLPWARNVLTVMRLPIERRSRR